MSARELQSMHAEVEESRLYSESQRSRVLANLHAMAKSVARLRNGTSESTATNLREALRIRLSILSDNVHGFISAADIDRRDRYQSMQELLNDVQNQSALLPALIKKHIDETLNTLHTDLAQLNKGLTGPKRREVEERFDRSMKSLQAELRGEEALPSDYCGSCYGASLDPKRCCNTCKELKEVYSERRWASPTAATLSSAGGRRGKGRASSRRGRMQYLWDDAGRARADATPHPFLTPNPHLFSPLFTLLSPFQVARVTGTFSISPMTRLPIARLQRQAALLLGHQRLQCHPPDQAVVLRHRLPRAAQPFGRRLAALALGAAVSRYFLKVVPTTYEFLGGQSVHTNQFSVTQYFKALGLGDTQAGQSMVPTVSFVFELTPLKVKKTERRGGSFLSFMTRSFALIGGLFTVAGILDGVLYTSTRKLEKLQLGKD